MSALVWRHGTTRAAAIGAIQAAIKKTRYAKYVTWRDGRVEARYGPFASVVHATGTVTDEAVVLERCGGVAGGAVLRKCQTMLEELFPSGQV